MFLVSYASFRIPFSHTFFVTTSIFFSTCCFLVVKQLWVDGFQGRGLDVNKILDGYKAVVDWPAASFYKVRHAYIS